MLPRTGKSPSDNRKQGKICLIFNQLNGRGSWIRTNDLQYPKLPRYQAALYPDLLGNDVVTCFRLAQQAAQSLSAIGGINGR